MISDYKKEKRTLNIEDADSSDEESTPKLTIMGEMVYNLNDQERQQVINFLNWLDSLDNEEICLPQVRVPTKIRLDEKVISFLNREGVYVYYHYPSCNYVIRLHKYEGFPGTFD